MFWIGFIVGGFACVTILGLIEMLVDTICRRHFKRHRGE